MRFDCAKIENMATATTSARCPVEMSHAAIPPGGRGCTTAGFPAHDRQDLTRHHPEP